MQILFGMLLGVIVTIAISCIAAIGENDDDKTGGFKK